MMKSHSPQIAIYLPNQILIQEHLSQSQAIAIAQVLEILRGARKQQSTKQCTHHSQETTGPCTPKPSDYAIDDVETVPFELSPIPDVIKIDDDLYCDQEKLRINQQHMQKQMAGLRSRFSPIAEQSPDKEQSPINCIRKLGGLTEDRRRHKRKRFDYLSWLS